MTSRKQQRLCEWKRVWRKTAEGMYATQKHKAAQRKIPWNLDFPTWSLLWMGKLHLRGNRHGDQLVMARYGDKGAYELGNVRIIPKRENDREREILSPVQYRRKRHPPKEAGHADDGK